MLAFFYGYYEIFLKGYIVGVRWGEGLGGGGGGMGG